MRAVAALLLASLGLPAAPAPVLVIYQSGVEAFGEAVSGLKAALGPSGFQALDLRGAGADAELARALASPDLRVAIAVGSESLAAVHSHNPTIPVIATMMLHMADARRGSHVDLDLPLSELLPEMRILLPQGRRVGLIRNPSHSHLTAEALEAAARKEGYTAVVVECELPADLLKSIGALKGLVDFVLCFPDAELFNAVTIKPFILASLEDRLPVIGFSAAFVRAGAAAGIYPDYQDIGRQTGEMALRVIRGEDRGGVEGPRKVRAAVNQRVARLLGVEFHTDSGSVEVFR
jgi:putative ABC transport system substrate-binding protein